MKKINKYILSMATMATLALSACSDAYMSDLNNDPSKATTIDPNAQLTTAVLQTYGDLGMVETYRSYHYAFTQHLMGCWNTTNYGGRHNPDMNEMSRVWTSLYPNALKNLTDGISRTDNDPDKVNINSCLRVYRAYLMSIITDTYGDAPCSEAGLGYIDLKYNPRYDTQEEIYNWLFTELETAVNNFDAAKDRITGDVIYGGVIANWMKFANSLRLRYAMRISNVAADRAKTEFEKALTAKGGVFTSASDDALIKYMNVAFSFGQDSYSDYRRNAMSQLFFGNDPANNASYICSSFFDQMYNSGDPRTFRICRFYYDGLMSSTAPDNRVDLTDEVLEKGVVIASRKPGDYNWEPWPGSYESDIMKELAKTNPSVETTMAKETEPKLANNFLRGDNPGVVITFAEVNFLLAEAALNGWSVTGTVEDYYKTGVREAMNFLTTNYECKAVSDEEFNEFIENNPVGVVKEQMKANINIQAWILHFPNPQEAWANVRRSGYPILPSPADCGYADKLVDATVKDIPVRLLYPVLESSYNKSGYDEAVARVANYNWHQPIWWNKK